MSITRDDVIAYLERLTVSELDDLIFELQRRLHLQPIPSKYPYVIMGAPPTMGMPHEQTEHDVELVAVGTDKIAVLKVVRELLPIGLMEAKKLVESAPVRIREALSKHEAEETAARLRRAGATVAIR